MITMLRDSYDDGNMTIGADGVDLVRYRSITAAGESTSTNYYFRHDTSETAGQNIVLAGAHDHPLAPRALLRPKLRGRG